MNSFIQRLLGLKSCTEIFTGACTQALPLDTSNNEDMTRWRFDQYQERCKAHALEVCDLSKPLAANALQAHDAEFMARQMDGLKIRAKYLKIWKRAMKKRFHKTKSISTSKAPVDSVVCFEAKRNLRRAS